MPYLERFSKKYLTERFTRFNDEITDIIDLVALFNMHNLYPAEKSNVYESFIEVYGLGGNEKLDEYPYFVENLFVINFPYINKRGKSVLLIEMVDYKDEIDIKERKQVIRHLKARLPEIIEIDKIEFKVR